MDPSAQDYFSWLTSPSAQTALVLLAYVVAIMIVRWSLIAEQV